MVTLLCEVWLAALVALFLNMHNMEMQMSALHTNTILHALQWRAACHMLLTPIESNSMNSLSAAGAPPAALRMILAKHIMLLPTRLSQHDNKLQDNGDHAAVHEALMPRPYSADARMPALSNSRPLNTCQLNTRAYEP